MSNPEKAVRDAAENFHKALTEAKAAGLAVTWPLVIDGLLSISISETGRATVKILDGSEVERGVDGAIHGQPLTLTDAERAALPALDPLRPDDPLTYALGQAKTAPATGIALDGVTLPDDGSVHEVALGETKPPKPRR